jgi:hypothetical protein
MGTKPPEWQKYKVGKPSTRKGWTEPDCVPFEKVTHVSHVREAFRMFEDQTIRSISAGSKGKLRHTAVVWLSPNFWTHGSRYGNVSFKFDWKTLVRDKRFYWVGTIEHPKTTACQILITKEHDLELDVYPYDTGEGPLYYDSEREIWYSNQKHITCEVMVDRDIPLSECETVSFEDHHAQYCNRDGPNCPDLDQSDEDGGAKLLGRLVGQRVLHHRTSLRRLLLDNGKLQGSARYAWRRILERFSRIKTTGDLSNTDAPALPVALAMLDRFDSKESVKELGSLFRSQKELELTVRQRVAAAFDIPLDNIPDSEDE